MFVHYQGKIINVDSIGSIDISQLAEKGEIKVYRVGTSYDLIRGPEAFNLVMTLCPASLEGEQASYHRHAWAVHNLLGHPLMQICSWLGVPKLGMMFHDRTVPNPITK